MGRPGRDATGHDQIPWMGCRRDEHVHHWRRMSRTIHRHERHPLPSLSQPGWIRSLSAGFFLFLCFTVSCTFYIRFTLISPLLSFLSYQHACVSAAMRFSGSQRDVCISLSLSFFFLSSSPFFFLLQLVQSMVPYPSGIRQKHLCGR